MNETKNARALFNSERMAVLSSALENAPAPPKKLNLKEALIVLAPELKTAIQRGHTVGSLTDVLNTQGMKASVRAVSQALRAASPNSAKVTKHTGRKTTTLENQASA